MPKTKSRKIDHYFPKIYYIFGNFGKVGFEQTDNTGNSALFKKQTMGTKSEKGM